jgi:hypothetical protein
MTTTYVPTQHGFNIYEKMVSLANDNEAKLSHSEHIASTGNSMIEVLPNRGLSRTHLLSCLDATRRPYHLLIGTIYFANLHVQSMALFAWPVVARNRGPLGRGQAQIVPLT